ncbi:MAG TPA: hypothetical protein VMH32_22940 [Burkholderiales bacterium]|nr:hypothetical protein [Burkholderiales bacterium]
MIESNTLRRLLPFASFVLAACGTLPEPHYADDHPASPQAAVAPMPSEPSALAGYRGENAFAAGLRGAGAEQTERSGTLSSPPAQQPPGHQHGNGAAQ